MSQQITHGGSRSRLYKIWKGMRKRCNNSATAKFHRYGAKGIRVCGEWENFPALRDWSLANGYAHDLTIDRLNVDGNYEPANCQWITRGENSKRLWAQRSKEERRIFGLLAKEKARKRVRKEVLRFPFDFGEHLPIEALWGRT